MPPLVEICRLPPEREKGDTYTSARCDSSEMYVTQRPSGATLAKRVPAGRNGVGLPEPSGVSGSAQCPLLPLPSTVTKIKTLPSGDQVLGYFSRSSAYNSSSTPEPSADLRYKSQWPFRTELNTILRPSGDHTGKSARAGSKVKRTGNPSDKS